jgi:hypothetical protein
MEEDMLTDDFHRIELDSGMTMMLDWRGTMVQDWGNSRIEGSVGLKSMCLCLLMHREVRLVVACIPCDK